MSSEKLRVNRKRYFCMKGCVVDGVAHTVKTAEDGVAHTAGVSHTPCTPSVSATFARRNKKRGGRAGGRAEESHSRGPAFQAHQQQRARWCLPLSRASDMSAPAIFSHDWPFQDRVARMIVVTGRNSAWVACTTLQIAPNEPPSSHLLSYFVREAGAKRMCNYAIPRTLRTPVSIKSYNQ